MTIRRSIVASRGNLPAFLFVLLSFAVWFLLSVQPAQSAQVTLAWDPSSDTAVTGYKLYWGAQGQEYALLADVGNSTSETVADLQPGITYYFAATAYDASGGESTYSNEVSYTAAAQAYTITASAGTGGTITPSGTATVNAGADQSFSISPNSGYTISKVTVDGTSMGAVNSYTFTNVTGNHTISATFAPNTYTLSIAKAGTGTGTVTTNPSGTTFTAGTSVTLTAAPSSGSTFAGWSGACSGTSQTCTVTMNSNVSVGVSFIVTTQTYTITASSGIGGSISPVGTATVPMGGTKTYTITPRIGYAISNVKVDGVSKGKITSYTFRNVTTNHKIQATFTRIRWR